MDENKSLRAIKLLNKEETRRDGCGILIKLGKLLKLSTYCISITLVWFHKYYAFHSLEDICYKKFCCAALFLAAKFTNEMHKTERYLTLDFILRKFNSVLSEGTTQLDMQEYTLTKETIKAFESSILTTFGFQLDVELPHPHVVEICHRISANKDLSRTAYNLATKCLAMSTMCLYHKPIILACTCMNLASRWLEADVISASRNWKEVSGIEIEKELIDGLTDELISMLGNITFEFQSDTVPFNDAVAIPKENPYPTPSPEANEKYELSKPSSQEKCVVKIPLDLINLNTFQKELKRS